ncbi:MAG: hypothetical protein A2Y03_09460 [Omnitrophica WOR_2 bacterium GWF2_38_59]|nr:MAG: hypothetical protein A2Y03_09460 [Omnitrophica WOR_2 bacterium GWF2_38_59]OGX49586.1 MAG: hypothetical protein A2243_11665 [Omnitrophica WOR_2 bacterium RIFOXYA2_FULL_38_17]OGX51708.1 MAG: hypothetical protein A2267_07035 [Omnitrophica WOR_2 bacterium RIFOXYA12_FULL_38_10]OGX54932.1 MAG: hypothetical protein A2447_05030 [Omnitrophica WOR_2 bacterium RIFOXYC2_FULL_38_12]OGX58868.1 MAG: hypothetical protein A2306_10765 [Omnitrophica WOR_2 bacterium RIFOXYB2_FULL_38_16]HBG61622.1 hypothet
MFFFYILVLTLGFVTSYTDIKFREIKNIHLLLAIGFGLAAYLCLIASHQRAFNINLVWNVLIGLGVGLILYFTDTWGAGDAKLFAVYCLLMPTEKYSRVLFFPSIAIFSNIFLISAAGILILSVKDIVKDRIKILKMIFSLGTLAEIGGSFLIVFSLNWVVEIAINRIVPQAKPLFSVLTLFFLYQIIRRLITKIKNKHIIVLILAVGLVSRFLVYKFDFNIEMFFSYLKMTFVYALLFQVVSIVFSLNKPDEKEAKRIPFAPLMFLGTILINTNFLNWLMNILRSIRK